jgi:hypothetical protein
MTGQILATPRSKNRIKDHRHRTNECHQLLNRQRDLGTPKKTHLDGRNIKITHQSSTLKQKIFWPLWENAMNIDGILDRQCRDEAGRMQPHRTNRLDIGLKASTTGWIMTRQA